MMILKMALPLGQPKEGSGIMLRSFRSLNCRTSAIAIIALCATGAHAQGAQTSTTPADQSASTADGNEARVEEIIVTAQRREESLQRVPIAISAVTANTAAQMGLTGTLGLQIAAPAVTFNQTSGGAAAITVRGVTGTGTTGDESPTSVYVDGVYLAGTPGLYFNLNNIERVEVLKGPQGTLFGRNSVGGSIQIITKTPKFEPALSVSAGYANYNTVETQLYGTTGLSETIAVDIAAYYSRQGEGWGKNIFTGQDVYKGNQIALRSKLLWEPDDATRIVASGSYSRVKIPALQGRGIFGNRRNLSGLSNIGFYNVDETYNGEGYSKQYTGSLNFRHDFGAVTFVSITGVEKTTSLISADADGARLLTQNTIGGTSTKALTQELQLLSSGGGRLDWIIGGYFFDATAKAYVLSTPNDVNNPITFTLSRGRSPIRSYAAFGQATWEVFDGTKITGGLRYTSDKRSLTGATGSQLVINPVPQRGKKDDKVTYRAAVSQQLTERIMLYGSMSTGFKSGLFSLTAPATPAVDPSFLKAYEVGFKAQLFDRRVQLDASAFRNSYRDVQVRARLPNNVGNILQNAASARAKGIDIDTTIVVSRAFSLRGGLAYLDSTYKSFPSSSCFVPRPDGIGNTNVICSATGNQTLQSPKLVYSIGATYRVETDIGGITLAATENHNSGFYFDAQNRVRNPSYDLLNLSAEWQSPVKTLSVRLWMRNLLGEKYYTALQASNNGDLVSPAEPRTYGVTLRADF